MINEKINNYETSKFNDRVCYNSLLEQKNNGRKFTKDDLTYDLLYQLSINEGIIDAMIGDIFNLTKEQVRYERVKNNISNIFLKKMIDSSDYYVEALEKAGILDIKEISKEDHAKLYLDSIRVYSDAKG